MFNGEKDLNLKVLEQLDPSGQGQTNLKLPSFYLKSENNNGQQEIPETIQPPSQRKQGIESVKIRNR